MKFKGLQSNILFLKTCFFELIVTFLTVCRYVSDLKRVNSVKSIDPQGKGPTNELFSSSRRTAVVSLLKIYTQCFCYFSGLVMLPHPQARARIMVGLEHPTFRLRGRDVTTCLAEWKLSVFAQLQFCVAEHFESEFLS